MRLLAILGLGALSIPACDLRACRLAETVTSRVPAPHPIPRDGKVGRDPAESQALVAWERKHFLDGYERVGRKDATWDDDARRLIEGSIGFPQSLSAAERMALGRAMYAHGCRDPLILYLLGRAIFDATWDSAEPEFFFTAAVEGMKEVAYPRALARYAASALYSRYDWRREPIGLRKPLRLLELRWFEEAMTDGSYGPGDDLVLYAQLNWGDGQDFFTRSSFRASAALERCGWVAPWIRLRFSGLKHHYEAWFARGRGWAKDVKPQQWQRFAAFNAQARHDLVESWRLRPDRPEAAFTMMSLAEDDPVEGESERGWFDRVVAAQMDFTPAYQRYLSHLLPRWGGSYEEMLAFGQEALDTGRFDTDVPLEAVRAVTMIADDQRDEEGGAGGVPIYNRPETYSLLTRVIEGYLREPSRTSERQRYEALWAVVAERAGKKAEALEHLKAAGYQLTGAAARHLRGETERQFVSRVALEAGPAAPEAAQGETRRKEDDVAGALEAYRAALAKEPSSLATPALRHWIAALELEQHAGTGGLTTLGDPIGNFTYTYVGTTGKFDVSGFLC